MLRKALFLTIVSLATIFTAHANVASAEKRDFRVGQMWSIKSATSTTAKIVIGRIDTSNDLTTVHTSLIDIPLPRGTEGREKSIAIDHVPFKISALAESVDELIAIDAKPPAGFEIGYQNWRKDKNAGVFDISASQVIILMLESIIRDRA